MCVCNVRNSQTGVGLVQGPVCERAVFMVAPLGIQESNADIPWACPVQTSLLPMCEPVSSADALIKSKRKVSCMWFGLMFVSQSSPGFAVAFSGFAIDSSLLWASQSLLKLSPQTGCSERVAP